VDGSFIRVFGYTKRVHYSVVEMGLKFHWYPLSSNPCFGLYDRSLRKVIFWKTPILDLLPSKKGTSASKFVCL